MSATSVRVTTEEESRKVAEESRETEWAGRSFLRELFLGNFILPLIHPFPRARAGTAGVHEVLQRPEDVPARRGRRRRDRRDGRVSGAGRRRPAQARRLRHEDPEGVRRPRLHGDASTRKVMQMIGSYDGNISRAALGAPVDRRSAAAQALRHARAEEEVPAALRRRRDLGLRAHRAARRLRSGEPLDHRRERDGDFYILNGEKLWCTNGTLAELLVVMARDPKTQEDQRASWSRPTGRASRSSTAAASWA